MKKMKKMKKFKEIIKIYLSLPQVWILISIIFLSIISMIISIYSESHNQFLSSLFANIFAGLLTGVVLSLLSSMKSISQYKSGSIIRWLEDMHRECKSFFVESRWIFYPNKDNKVETNEKYEKVYDLVCLGNSICNNISQGQFNKTYPFNTYKYCKKHLEFDVFEHKKINDEIMEKIKETDIDNLSVHQIRELLDEMYRYIMILNKAILDEKKRLEVKLKIINMS